MSDDMRRNARMGLNARWYETECPVRRDLLFEVWDEMPYAKGLIARVKGLNALCEGIWFDIFCI